MKTDAYPFLVKTYKILRTKPDIFVLKKLRDCQGDCDVSENRIRIDYRQAFISTLIHEIIHYIYPEWKEYRVLRYEKKLMNAFSVRQVKNILKRFAQFL